MIESSKKLHPDFVQRILKLGTLTIVVEKKIFRIFYLLQGIFKTHSTYCRAFVKHKKKMKKISHTSKSGDYLQCFYSPGNYHDFLFPNYHLANCLEMFEASSYFENTFGSRFLHKWCSSNTLHHTNRIKIFTLCHSSPSAWRIPPCISNFSRALLTKPSRWCCGYRPSFLRIASVSSVVEQKNVCPVIRVMW